MSTPSYHGWTHRRKARGGTDPTQYDVWRELMVYAPRGALAQTLPDTAIVVDTGDGQHYFEVSEEEDGHIIVEATASVSLAGAVTVQLRNATQATDLLSTRITIDTGETSSYTAASQRVINTAVVLAKGDLIFVDVDAADGTAEGLIVRVATGLP